MSLQKWVSSDDLFDQVLTRAHYRDRAFLGKNCLRLASAGLTVTTATTAALTTAGGLLSLISGLGAVVLATGVTVTESCVTRIFQLQVFQYKFPILN